MTDQARERRRLTKAVNALRELIKQGTPSKAAASLGISERTLQRRINDYCVIFGYNDAVTAAYWLDRVDRAKQGEIGQSVA